jgi:hypothetical protein
MKTTRSKIGGRVGWLQRLVFVPCACACLILGGCADGGASVALYYVFISNMWSVQGQPDRFFSFASDDDNKTEGAFTGTEEAGGVVHAVSGSWADNEIEFVSQRNPGVKYFATVSGNAPSVLTFESPIETITLGL